MEKNNNNASNSLVFEQKFAESTYFHHLDFLTSPPEIRKYHKYNFFYAESLVTSEPKRLVFISLRPKTKAYWSWKPKAWEIWAHGNY